MEVEVRVAGGVVRGSVEADLTVFRGIPYAALPVRFGAPEQVQEWAGVREATRFGPPPPQSVTFGTDALTGDGDEWLTADVWSPDLGGELPAQLEAGGQPHPRPARGADRRAHP